MAIYIAHSTPQHNDEANDARTALGTCDSQMQLVCSQDFDELGRSGPTGANYPDWQTAFMDTTELVVLLPPADVRVPDISIGIQLGTYLEVCRAAGKTPSVTVLHHPDVDPKEIASKCPANNRLVVPGRDMDIRDFIGKVFPTQRNGNILDVVTSGLLNALKAGGPDQRYTTCPTLTVAVRGDDLKLLAKGQIPPEAGIGGYEWEHMFNQPPGTSGVTWGDLQGVVTTADWEPILAEELDWVHREQHRQRHVIPVLLRDGTAPPTAAVVQKYEVYPVKSIVGGRPVSSSIHRFSLAAFQAPMLYNAGDMSPLANAFHLTVVAQLYRFAVIEPGSDTFKRLEFLAGAAKRVANYEQMMVEGRSELRRNILLINVECARRNFVNRAAHWGDLVFKSYGVEPGSDPSADAEQSRLSAIMSTEWMPLGDRISAALAAERADPKEILAAVLGLAAMNAEAITIAANAYARLAVKAYKK